MTTSSRISINPSELDSVQEKNISLESALKASQILQENHEIHHVLFNVVGLHNHIVHQITADLALGASPEQLEQHYLNNKSYQRPLTETKDIVLQDLKDPKIFRSMLGDKAHYVDFLEFFREEIKDKGLETVVNRYVFHGDELANGMLQQFVTLHALIHVTCGIEFKQPAIVAEGLALTAITDFRIGDFFALSQAEAISSGIPCTKSFVQLLESVRTDESVIAATKWGSPLKVFNDGPIQNATTEMAEYARQWNVGSVSLKEKMAELANAAALVVGGSQQPPKIVKLDFILIHGLTQCHYLLVLLGQPWISEDSKVRLVEWAGRMQIASYALANSPKLYLDEIKDYVPKKPTTKDAEWASLVSRALELQDDGHTIKVIRALIDGQQVCKEFEEKENFLVKGDMWQKIGHMCLDAVEDTNARWVRLAGFAEAWEEFPDRAS